MDKRVSNPIRINKDSLYDRCLYRMAELCHNAGKELSWSEVDRLVLEVSRQYVPGEEANRLIEKVTTNIVYGFTDDIPF